MPDHVIGCLYKFIGSQGLLSYIEIFLKELMLMRYQIFITEFVHIHALLLAQLYPTLKEV